MSVIYKDILYQSFISIKILLDERPAKINDA